MHSTAKLMTASYLVASNLNKPAMVSLRPNLSLVRPQKMRGSCNKLDNPLLTPLPLRGGLTSTHVLVVFAKSESDRRAANYTPEWLKPKRRSVASAANTGSNPRLRTVPGIVSQLNRMERTTLHS